VKTTKKHDDLLDMNAQQWSPQDMGLDTSRYEAALRFLFDRPVPQGQEQEWYWEFDEPEFEATPLEWTRIQTVLFANAGRDLARYGDEQVGMGLNYVMSNMVSNVPFAATDASVPLDEAMRMMDAMPLLWRDCFGVRLKGVNAPIGSATGRLAYACYMWFDVWPTFRLQAHVPDWQVAIVNVFRAMLEMPCREVQVAALHGIGHNIGDEGRALMEQLVDDFLQRLDPRDEELRNYARAARAGEVQ
jgi:hypothetical protein